MKQYIKALVFTALCAAIPGCNDKKIYFHKDASYLNGTSWACEAAPSGIFEEVEYVESGLTDLDYNQFWTFDIVGRGRVTVSWTAYRSGSVDASESYYTVYDVSENGEYTVVFDSRNAEEYPEYSDTNN